jgi:hypothetical protein
MASSFASMQRFEILPNLRRAGAGPRGDVSREIFKGPIVYAVDVVRDVHEQASRHFFRLNAVLHAEVTALVVVGRIQFTTRIGAGTERGTGHFHHLLKNLFLLRKRV